MAAAEVRISNSDLRRLTRALLQEADGKALRRDLSRNLRVAAEPVLIAVRASILTMPSKGQSKGQSMRAAIAAATRVHVRVTSGGVEIISHNTGIPRKFRNAARKFNSTKPWRHPVFGDRQRWVEQISRKPRWFVDPILAGRESFTKAAGEAMDAVARRIDMKTRG